MNIVKAGYPVIPSEKTVEERHGRLIRESDPVSGKPQQPQGLLKEAGDVSDPYEDGGQEEERQDLHEIPSHPA